MAHLAAENATLREKILLIVRHFAPHEPPRQEQLVELLAAKERERSVLERTLEDSDDNAIEFTLIRCIASIDALKHKIDEWKAYNQKVALVNAAGQDAMVTPNPSPEANVVADGGTAAADARKKASDRVETFMKYYAKRKISLKDLFLKSLADHQVKSVTPDDVDIILHQWRRAIRHHLRSAIGERPAFPTAAELAPIVKLDDDDASAIDDATTLAVWTTFLDKVRNVDTAAAPAVADLESRIVALVAQHNQMTETLDAVAKELMQPSEEDVHRALEARYEGLYNHDVALLARLFALRAELAELKKVYEVK